MTKKIILASNSPRRMELLKNCNIIFDVVPHKFDEKSSKVKNPIKFAEFSAFNKAASISILPEFQDKFVLGVDTIVVFKNKILGKPENKNEAEKYIRMMSGKKNTVISGISLINKQDNISMINHCVSKVYFNKLHESFIKYYLDNNHWEGYAGGYAIQGIFSLVIKKIIGSYTNIVGLPMEVLFDMLNKLKLFP
jgi:septum formation protein